MRYITIVENKVYFQGRSYPIYFIPKDEFKYKPWQARGYVSGRTIYIREGTRIGLERLILHEIGHILGYDHTWYPFIMHPSWVGRWFWRWNKDDNLQWEKR